MSLNKLKINLYGEAWKLKRLFITGEFMEIIETKAALQSRSVPEIVMDPFFYPQLKSKKIQSVEDWEGKSREGLMNSNKNQIEMWYSNRKVQKLKINDLNQELLLFPLYNTIIHQLPLDLEKGIYMEQKEIGLIGSFETVTENFFVDDLVFHLLQKSDSLLLESMVYKNQILTCKKKDTLITFQNFFEVK